MQDEGFAALLESVPTRVLRALTRFLRPVLGWQWRLGLSPKRRYVLAAAFFVGLPALVVMAQLQSLLSAMHLPGATAYSLTDLAFPPGHADAAVLTWLDHAAETTQKFAGPIRLSVIFLLVDTFLFVPAYAIVLAAASAVAFRRLHAANDDDPLLPAYRTMTATAFAAVPLLVFFDLLENASSAIIVAAKGDAPDALEWALTAFWLVKWSLAALIVIPLAIAAIAVARRGATSGVDLWRTVVVLRVPIGVVGFFGVLLFAPVAAQQFDDLIRRWIGPDWNELIVTVLLTLVLSAVIAAVCWRLLMLQQEPGAQLPLSVPFWASVALFVLAAILLFAGVGGRGLFALGVILLAVAALSYPIRHVTAPARPAATFAWAGAPALLASLPLTLLGLAAVRASVFELVFAGNHEYALLVLLGLALQALGWGTFALAVARGPAAGPAPQGPADGAAQPAGGRAAKDLGVPWALILAAGVVAAVALAVWISPLDTGDLIGTVGAISAFLTGILLLGYVALRLEREWLAPQVFLIFGLRRFPVILIVVLWAIVAAMLDPGGYHNIRTIERTDGRPTTLEQAFRRWLTVQPTRAAVPLVLVAAEGGGIRAAYWTARALDCTIDADYESCGFVPQGDPGDPQAVFAASGVSGGSVGLVDYVAAVRARERGNWPDQRLGDDFLSATSAWTLFTDLPNALVKLDLHQDRAAILERAWQDAWDTRPSPLSAGLLATENDRGMPLLLLNGTSVQDGCRVSASALDADVQEPTTEKALRARDCLSMGAFEAGSSANPGQAALAATHDLVDLLCPDQDVRLSTAALMSARFPWVSPAGRVLRCDRRTGKPTDFATYVVDGRLLRYVRRLAAAGALGAARASRRDAQPQRPGTLRRAGHAPARQPLQGAAELGRDRSPVGVRRAAADRPRRPRRARERRPPGRRTALLGYVCRRRDRRRGRPAAPALCAPVPACPSGHVGPAGLGALEGVPRGLDEPAPGKGECQRARQDPPLVLPQPLRALRPRRLPHARPRATPVDPARAADNDSPVRAFTREEVDMHQIAVVARLRDGMEPRAAELIREGPPFDLETAGFERHSIFLSATEVVFVFEGDEVEWLVDKLVDEPFAWDLNDAFAAWRPLVEEPPRLARPQFAWERV